MILSGSEVKLTGQEFPGSSFSPLLKMGILLEDESDY